SSRAADSGSAAALRLRALLRGVRLHDVHHVPAAAVVPQFRNGRPGPRARGRQSALAADTAVAAVGDLPGEVRRRAAVGAGPDGRRVGAAVPGGWRAGTAGTGAVLAGGVLGHAGVLRPVPVARSVAATGGCRGDPLFVLPGDGRGESARLLEAGEHQFL